MMSKKQGYTTVLHLAMNKHVEKESQSGEKIPCLVKSSTRVPLRLPTRWMLIRRRFQVASSTLTTNMRALGKLYTWAYQMHDIDLDDFLVESDLCDALLLDSLVTYLYNRSVSKAGIVYANSYNYTLHIITDFLTWCLHLANRGGNSDERNSSLALKRLLYIEYFEEQQIPGRQSESWPDAHPRS